MNEAKGQQGGNATGKKRDASALEQYREGPPLPIRPHITAALPTGELLAFLELELGPGHRYHEIGANEQMPNGRVDVSGALVYGDHDHVQVSVSRNGQMYTVSDDGNALWRAGLRTEDMEPTDTQRFFADSMAKTWLVGLDQDELLVTRVWLPQLALYTQRVLLASWAVERWV